MDTVALVAGLLLAAAAMGLARLGVVIRRGGTAQEAAVLGAAITACIIGGGLWILRPSQPADPQIVEVTALMDEVLAEMNQRLADIERVAAEGAGPGDDELVRFVFLAAAGNVYLHRAGVR